MCSGINPRTRDNPESAMVHNTMRVMVRHHNIAGPMLEVKEVPWPWPKGDPAHEAMLALVRHDLPPCSTGEAKPEPQHFDSEAHRAFMRGLG